MYLCFLFGGLGFRGLGFRALGFRAYKGTPKEPKKRKTEP